MTTRREFLRQIAILLSSLMVTHCTPSPGQGKRTQPAQSELTQTRLRKCWLSLVELEEQARTDYQRGREMSARLQTDHRAALDDLVEAGELDAVTAGHVQAIYDEALDHIQSSLGTCYEAIPIYVPDARGQLMQQADLLAEMAEKGDVDPQAVAQAQAALERDIAFLKLSEPDKRALYGRVAADTAYPPFDELDLEITPPTAQATQFLVDVLLQE